MITIYINGCACGDNGRLVRRVQKWARNNMEDVEVRDTRYDKDAREQHRKAISIVGEKKDSLMPVVVHASDTDGMRTLSVTPLKVWNK